MKRTPHIQSRFPYGVSEVPNHEELRSRYANEVPALANDAPLPTHLPRRHPVLEQVVGTFRVYDALPPWWQSCMHALIEVCPCLQPLLCTVSQAEFRQGSIDQQRWRRWRTTHCQRHPSTENPGEGRAVPCWQHYGPGLYWMLDKVLPPSRQKQAWMDQFVSRGNKALPADLDLVITADPAWWLNMSNGYRWYTCMGSSDDRDPRIIGNWYDTGVLLAALVAHGSDCWTPESLIARTTVRLVEDQSHLPHKQEAPEQEQAGAPVASSDSAAYRLVLGRIYQNDMTAASNLLVHLVHLFAARGLSWGCIAGTNTVQFAQSGLLGSVVVEETAQQRHGVSFWRPERVEAPYLDGEAFFLEHTESEQEGLWTCPSLTVHACRLQPAEAMAVLSPLATGKEDGR